MPATSEHGGKQVETNPVDVLQPFRVVPLGGTTVVEQTGLHVRGRARVLVLTSRYACGWGNRKERERENRLKDPQEFPGCPRTAP